MIRKEWHVVRLATAVCLVTFLWLLAGRALEDESAQAFIARIEGRQSPERQGFDPYTLQELMEKVRVPGVSVAVIRDFKVHWAKAYGVADVTTDARVDSETLFQAASISKPVAAMAAPLSGAAKPVLAGRPLTRPSRSRPCRTADLRSMPTSTPFSNRGSCLATGTRAIVP